MHKVLWLYLIDELKIYLYNFLLLYVSYQAFVAIALINFIFFDWIRAKMKNIFIDYIIIGSYDSDETKIFLNINMNMNDQFIEVGYNNYALAITT